MPFNNPTNKPLFTLTALSILLPILALAPIKREQTPHRQLLTELETKPLDPAVLASLTNWTHPGTLDPANTQGKVVALAVVSISNPQSFMTISKLTRMARDYKDQGLVVAAIHPDALWDQMYEKVEAGRVTIPVARDQDALFATAMHTDDYPDLYLIDRAGNLRFADLDNRALKPALKLLISETPETASSNAALQAQGLDPVQPETTSENTPGATPQDTHQDTPQDHNTDGSDTPTSSTNWPPHNDKNLYADMNHQGQPLPVPLGNEEWLTDKVSLENKVLIIQFWSVSASTSKNVNRLYTKLQEDHPENLQIVRIGGYEDREKVTRKLSYKESPYAELFDENQTLFKALAMKTVPNVVVLSTDGIIRWQGFPLERGFSDAVNQIIQADPGLPED